MTLLADQVGPNQTPHSLLPQGVYVPPKLPNFFPLVANQACWVFWSGERPQTVELQHRQSIRQEATFLPDPHASPAGDRDAVASLLALPTLCAGSECPLRAGAGALPHGVRSTVAWGR